MTTPLEDPVSREPAHGLADPRIDQHGPQILGSGADVESEHAPADVPAGRDGTEDPEGGSGGLADPRVEIPGP